MSSFEKYFKGKEKEFYDVRILLVYLLNDIVYLSSPTL